jgi:hypothetical protein
MWKTLTASQRKRFEGFISDVVRGQENCDGGILYNPFVAEDGKLAVHARFSFHDGEDPRAYYGGFERNAVITWGGEVHWQVPCGAPSGAE